MKTYEPTKDRSYYRSLNDWELLELAKSVQTTELEIVLAERLKKAKDEKYYPNGDDD
jgi:hypothetical protein